MEGLSFSMGSVVIPKTLLRIQCFGAAVLGLIVLVTMITAASPAAGKQAHLSQTAFTTNLYCVDVM